MHMINVENKSTPEINIRNGMKVLSILTHNFMPMMLSKKEVS